jgi:hypothetical protein
LVVFLFCAYVEFIFCAFTAIPGKQRKIFSLISGAGTVLILSVKFNELGQGDG